MLAKGKLSSAGFKPALGLEGDDFRTAHRAAALANAAFDATGGDSWRLLVDTNVPDGEAEQVFAVGDPYGVTGRSLLLFVLG